MNKTRQITLALYRCVAPQYISYLSYKLFAFIDIRQSNSVNIQNCCNSHQKLITINVSSVVPQGFSFKGQLNNHDFMGVRGNVPRKKQNFGPLK